MGNVTKVDKQYEPQPEQSEFSALTTVRDMNKGMVEQSSMKKEIKKHRGKELINSNRSS